MSEQFAFDVFLSHSSRDKADVREAAERLRADGLQVWFDEWVLKPGDNIPATIEFGLEQSRVLVLCMSANAFGSDWAQLESGTFRFRDPLNKERRFIPMRLDDAPIKGSLAQFLYINWLPANREREYAKLLEACRSTTKSIPANAEGASERLAEQSTQLKSTLPRLPNIVGLESQHNVTTGNDTTKSVSRVRSIHMLEGHRGRVFAVALSEDAAVLVSGANNGSIRLWNVQSGECIRTLKGHKHAVREIVISSNERIYSSCEDGSIGVWDFKTGELITTFRGHSQAVYGLAIAQNGKVLVSSSKDGSIRIWDVDKEACSKVLHYGRSWVNSIAIVPGGNQVLAGSEDGAINLWDITTGKREELPKQHSGWVWSIALSPISSQMVSGSSDSTVRLWDLQSRKWLAVFEGHRDMVSKVAVTKDGRWVVSGSIDKTAIIWDVKTGVVAATLRGHDGSVESVAISNDGRLVITGSNDGRVGVWTFATDSEDQDAIRESITYTNAKVLLVGDTHSGKTGLTHRLATGEWKPSEDSTVGAWSTQLKLKDATAQPGLERDIWLWDFGGQADQRLIHQLYMDRAALILVLFNADQEDVLPGLRDWRTALRRCVKEEIPQFLVAGRIDTGFKASRGKLQTFSQEQGLAYYETSAKSGEGCDELRAAMFSAIMWAQIEKRTSPRIFKLIKDEILKLRDEGQVLHTFKELRELLWRRLPNGPRFTDEILQTVIGLLDGPGAVKELDYGTYILLAPEWINAYAQAVIRTLRSAENGLGVLPMHSIAEGKLIYQSVGRDGVPVQMMRLPPAEERVVLGEMERQLEQRGLCLRQGNKLVFPSHCGRDRPAVREHPSVFVSYAVKGFLDDIYSTLVVKLADSESFQLKELWRDAADFVTLMGDHRMGLTLRRESGSDGHISVYFGKGVTEEEQVIFANYIHAHLKGTCDQALRLRHYVCPRCHVPKGNSEVLMKRLLAKKQGADTECDGCGERFPLWDALEKRYASDAVRKEVEKLQTEDLVQLNRRKKGKLLVLEVGARITSANQKWIEVPGDEDDGIDMMVEFTDEDGNGMGTGLCLQLKAGNSHLTTRRTDGVEVFAIKKQRWVKTCMNQPYPVMLVIGSFSEEDERDTGRQKVEFNDVRWMEISSVLKRESENGAAPVNQIEFKGERLDLSSVRKWRERCLSCNAS